MHVQSCPPAVHLRCPCIIQGEGSGKQGWAAGPGSALGFLGEIPEHRPVAPLAPRTLRNRAGMWWGGETESEELRIAAPLKQTGPELDVPLGGLDGGGRYIAAGCAGPGSEQPHGSPRCGTDAAAVACPRRVLRPSRARRGLPGGRGSAAEPPHPRSFRTRGDSAGKFEEWYILEENKKENTPSSPKTPVESLWLLPPPRTETPNLPGTTE